MTKLTDSQLKTLSGVIKNETIANANTALRVGQMFEDTIDSKVNINTLTGYTATTNSSVTTIQTAYVSGATNLGGVGLFTIKSAHKLNLKGLVAGANVILTPSSTGITIASSGGSSGTISGSTNGLSLSGGGKLIRLGGALTGSTIFTDNRITKSGLQYGGNYSTGFTNLSLVHKSFVTGITSNQYLGTIYNVNTWASTSGFTTVGGTVNVTANKFVLTAGTFDFTKSLDYNYYTELDKIIISCDLKVTAASAYGIGIHSFNTTQLQGMAAYVDTAGNVYVGSGTNLLTQRVQGATLSTSTNDVVNITLEKDQGLIRATFWNKTTNAITTVSGTFTYNPTGTDMLPFNLGKPCVWNLSNNAITVNSITISSYEYKNANVFVGDSKTARRTVESIGKSYVDIITDEVNLTAINAGNSDRTDHVLLKLPEILSLFPARVYLNIGRNDITGGVTATTIQANLTTIFNTLTAANIPVTFLLGFYESGGAQNALNTWITTNYPNNYIDTSFYGTTSDGVHPDKQYHYRIAQAIKASGTLIRTKPHKSPAIQNSISFADENGQESRSRHLTFIDGYDQGNSVFAVGDLTNPVGYSTWRANYAVGSAFVLNASRAGVLQMGINVDNFGTYGGGTAGEFYIGLPGNHFFGINGLGKIYIGHDTAPTASLHIKAGSTAAGSAPIKLTSGSTMTTPENGAIEYDGLNLSMTIGTTRKNVPFLDSIATTTGTSITLNFNNNIQRMFKTGSATNYLTSTGITITLSNNTNALVFNWVIFVNANMFITMPSNFFMPSNETRWTSGTKKLNLNYINKKIELSATYDGTNWGLKATADFV